MLRVATFNVRHGSRVDGRANHRALCRHLATRDDASEGLVIACTHFHRFWPVRHRSEVQ
jgi:hypothetical protein